MHCPGLLNQFKCIFISMGGMPCIMCQFGLAVCGHVGVATQASCVLFITRRGVRVPAVVSRMLLVDDGGRV